MIHLEFAARLKNGQRLTTDQIHLPGTSCGTGWDRASGIRPGSTLLNSLVACSNLSLIGLLGAVLVVPRRSRPPNGPYSPCGEAVMVELGC
jgi:hypothetical protein